MYHFKSNDMSWHNTTNESNVRELNQHAKNQEDAILNWFKEDSARIATPFQVLEQMNLNCPITSVRRAMTNLTTRGELRKTGIKVKAKYGKRNYLWTLA
jgi:hypothetical protein